jgi:hypothetical protein
MGGEIFLLSLEVANNYNGGLDGNKIYLSDFYSLRVGCIVCGIKRCRRTVKINRQNRY